MESKIEYFPPKFEILEMNFEGVMCLSGDMNIDNFVGENRDPWEE